MISNLYFYSGLFNIPKLDKTSIYANNKFSSYCSPFIIRITANQKCCTKVCMELKFDQNLNNNIPSKIYHDYKLEKLTWCVFLWCDRFLELPKAFLSGLSLSALSTSAYCISNWQGWKTWSQIWPVVLGDHFETLAKIRLIETQAHSYLGHHMLRRITIDPYCATHCWKSSFCEGQAFVEIQSWISNPAPLLPRASSAAGMFWQTHGQT